MSYASTSRNNGEGFMKHLPTLPSLVVSLKKKSATFTSLSVSEGKGNQVYTFQPYASWESAQDWPDAKSQPMKAQKQHALQIFYLQITQKQTAHPPGMFKKHCAVFYFKASMWGSLSTGSKLRQEQRGNMLLSPVCVPSVCKLNQQHELDHQENEAADGSHIAPHCGIGGES